MAARTGSVPADRATPDAWRQRLGRAIGGTLALKLLALAILWGLCFSGPHRLAVNATAVRAHFTPARAPAQRGDVAHD